MQERSQLYAQLAQLEHAGVPARRALQGLGIATMPRLARAVQETLLRLDRAQPLADAGRAAGLFLPWEAELIAAGTDGGQLEAVYRRLAAHHEQGERRIRQFKSRMVMPAAVLLLALFVLPLPALARGEFDIGGYLLRSLLPVVLLLTSLQLLRAAWHGAAATMTSPPGFGLLRQLPGLGSLLLRLQQADGLNLLSLLLAAGLPADRALELAGRTLRDPALRRGCVAAAAQARAGHSMADAIRGSGLCDEAQGMALISSGEAAGRLDDGIARYAADLDFRLGLQLDQITEWLPRIIYFGLTIPLVF
ncbi:MAG TPA: type II secretion system F family protein [Solimonas sp.]|nr:type II secretion system F family protein [Solimonas sp.]